MFIRDHVFDYFLFDVDVQQDKEKLVSMLSKLQSSTPGKIFAVITDAWSSSLSMKAVLNQFETSSSLDGVLDSLAVIGFDDSGYLDGKLINEFANEAHSAHFKDHLWSLYSCSRGYQLPQLAPLSRKFDLQYSYIFVRDLVWTTSNLCF